MIFLVSEKLQKLQQMLERQPNDTFLLYGIAMEHKKSSDWKTAIEFFDRAIQSDINYCYAYFQKGQVNELAGDMEAAKRAYQDGIVAAGRAGDQHALGEIQGALSMIE
jgi:tetratricopeptide (TPR) repeat protein